MQMPIFNLMLVSNETSCKGFSNKRFQVYIKKRVVFCGKMSTYFDLRMYGLDG